MRNLMGVYMELYYAKFNEEFTEGVYTELYYAKLMRKLLRM